MRLAGSMLAFQASIGALNDVLDVARDRIGKPAKPLVAGSVSTALAVGWAVLALVMGLTLALPSGAPTVLIGGLGVGLGYAYDLRLSRTGLSWLPLALALPLVPAFAWLGAAGTLPSGLGGLAPAAVLAGTGLMIGNGLVDLERDEAAGKASIAVSLGARGSRIVHGSALAAAVALVWLLAPAPPPGSVLAAARAVGLAAGTVALAVGWVLMGRASPRIRERGWELEAIGTAVLGLAWLAGISASGGGAGL